MTYNPEIHHRRTIRLRDYDYSQSGAYFLTICIQDRECLFGNVVNGEMQLHEAGKAIQKWWDETAIKFKNIELDESVVMPNHFHGVIFIVGADLRVCPDINNDDKNKGEHTGSPLHKIVQWFKTMTTNEYIRGIKLFDWSPFNGKLWQRNYYEHIIRNDAEMNRIREYILNNPLQWDSDSENPENVKGL